MEVTEDIFDDYPDVVTFEQLREMLGNIGKTLAYTLLKNNEIESFKMGRNYRILKSKVIEYLKKQQTKQPTYANMEDRLLNGGLNSNCYKNERSNLL